MSSTTNSTDKLAVLKKHVEDATHSREDAIRESWVRAMEARLVREQLDKCHRAEGVNHYENCRWLQDLYLDKMKAGRVHGWKKIDV